jgi:hypothetical protein
MVLHWELHVKVLFFGLMGLAVVVLRLLIRYGSLKKKLIEN